jgi:hypothetical protein
MRPESAIHYLAAIGFERKADHPNGYAGMVRQRYCALAKHGAQ